MPVLNICCVMSGFLRWRYFILKSDQNQNGREGFLQLEVFVRYSSACHTEIPAVVWRLVTTYHSLITGSR